MKISIPMKCTCGHTFMADGLAGEKLATVECPACNGVGYTVDPLSISLVAERLLLRSKSEIDAGDFTVSIICSAMAVECALTQLFLKWKEVAHLGQNGAFATQLELEAFEKEYPRSGGFVNPADFVSKYVVGCKFDEFIVRNAKAEKLAAAAGVPAGASSTDFFQNSLFKLRNRVMHWGNVSYTKSDAEQCYKISSAIFFILKEMDEQKYSNLEKGVLQP